MVFDYLTYVEIRIADEYFARVKVFVEFLLVACDCLHFQFQASVLDLDV